MLRAGDRLHIAASHMEIELFFKLLGQRKEKIKKVIICGGGRVSYYLSTQLCKIGMQVKIIEIDEKKCENLCELLPKATVINGDATDHDLLIEEGIQDADALIALTGMDEENIIMSLFAKSQGVSKIIVKVNEDRRARMIQEFGIDSIVSAKAATADASLVTCVPAGTLREARMWKRCTNWSTEKWRLSNLYSEISDKLYGHSIKGSVTEGEQSDCMHCEKAQNYYT